MKKTILAVCAIFAFAVNANSQSKSDVTYEQMIQANTHESLSKRHKNWHVHTIPANALKNSIQLKAYGRQSYLCYNEPDLIYYEDATKGMNNPNVDVETGLYTRNGTYWHEYNRDNTETFGVQWCAMTPEEKKSQIWGIENFKVIEDGSGCGEVLVSAVDNEDGTITVITNAPAVQAGDIAHLPSKWKKATVEYKYLLDAKNLDCKVINGYIITKNGKKIDFFEEEVNYDIDYSGNPNMQALLDFEKKLMSEKPVNLRTATIIYNPGTPEEEVFTKVSDMSYQVFMFFRKGYKAFENAELTVPFEGSKNRSEFTVYLTPEK